ncbi:MAG: flap endonuclease [Kiritimatiellae bacterium]|nr:flap endonuclease [Kiritimatiellia bacterium]
MPGENLLLVDGTAVAYRAFYAIGELATKDGRPTNALFGFVRMLGQLKEVWKPSHWAVAFDGGLPAERTAVLETYKAQRKPMPDALAAQLDAIDEYLVLAEIPWLLIQGQEADDILATMTRRGLERGAEVMIATSDKDMYQLVGEQVSVIPPSKAGSRMGPAEVREKTGVDPAQIPEWLALVGDSVDNIPGVPGVGPKTAAQLLNQWGSLDAVWANLPKVGTERLRAALEAHQDVVRRNLALVRLRGDMDFRLDWDDLQVRPPDRERLAPFFDSYELKSLAK